ncbi:type II toxin-antitoxin system RelE/ParE family toxin [Orrella marina]
MGYIFAMYSIRTTECFDDWFMGLRDIRARVRIQTRIDRLEMGNPGDSKSVGGGIVELRINYGPGYRVYYVQRGEVLVVLLCGGDKSSQQNDIARAKEISSALDLE